MTIFRGPGGGGNATSDSALNALAALTSEAANSATLAGVSATAASVSAGNAASSAAAAASSASGASTSATTATTQASAASTSASGASTSASNGAASAAAALASQNASAASQSTASTAATTATTQAGLATTNGAAQVALATTQAGNAATSAAASSTSAAGSASSASSAFNSAATATTQAGIATTQAGLATTNGAAQVALATTQAGNAALSATGASSSASAASTSASNAATSATNASNSATAAANSAASINDANLVHKTGNETIEGIKTFSSTVVGSVSGNAGTATTATNQSGGTVSAASIAYSTTLTGGTGVVNLGSGQVYKDASGNVGIGTSTPLGKLQIKTQTNGNALFQNSTSVAGGVKINSINDAGSASVPFELDGSTLQFNIGSIERARINTSGNLLVGTTVAGGQLTVKATAVIAPASFQVFNDGNTGISLKNSAGGVAGSVVVNTSAVAYNTSSDYRLKNTIAPMTGSLDKVALLKPVTYKWLVDGSDGQGFIAHELAEVEPGCVSGEKDAVDAEGKPQYQGIDTSFLVATLAAAIQELKAIVDKQAVKIAALEAK